MHVLFVCFVVFGLLAIYLGWFLQWSWIRNRRFRLLHLLAIAVVVVQSWLGMICPLTIWEMDLREAAGAVTYSGSFIQYWLHKVLYYRAPDWIFISLYSLFGALVLASWFLVSPDKRKTR
jgi:glucan phosphoethanolaminetransferase (alkaline phosphatase superfamily)